MRALFARRCPFWIPEPGAGWHPYYAWLTDHSLLLYYGEKHKERRRPHKQHHRSHHTSLLRQPDYVDLHTSKPGLFIKNYD